MTIEAEGRRIDVAGTPVEIVRKDIKNLHVGVYPPSGRVRVAAPLRLNDDAVRLAVISRLGWIRRRQAEFERQERQSLREFVTGESHYFAGRRYRLDVTERDGPAGRAPAQQRLDGVKRSPRRRPGQTGGRASSLVPPSTPRPLAGAARKMGAAGRSAPRRSPHQADEDPLGGRATRPPAASG